MSLQTLNLVVTTGAVKILIKLVLVKCKNAEGQREQRSLGFSCVVFAYMSYLSVVMRQFCPFGGSSLCIATREVPLWPGKREE